MGPALFGGRRAGRLWTHQSIAGHTHEARLRLSRIPMLYFICGSRLHGEFDAPANVVEACERL